jgi:hypothetical protein
MSDSADYLPPDYSTGQSVDPNAATVVPGVPTNSGGTAAAGSDPSSPSSGGVSEDYRHAADGFDLLNKSADLLKHFDVGLGLPGLGLPGNVIKADDANRELLKHDYKNGVPDAIAADAGVGGDVAEILGKEGAGKALGVIKSGAELYKGANEMKDAVSRGDTQSELEAGSDLVTGYLDGASAVVPGPVGMVAKAASLGWSAGNALAPYVFGDKKTDASVQTDDGVYHASTGNRVIDAALGAGKSSKEGEPDYVTNDNVQGQINAYKAGIMGPDEKAAFEAKLDRLPPFVRQAVGV